MHYSTHLLRHLRFTIGQNLHARRVKRKWTLKKLSRLTGIPAHKLDQYELGKGEIRLDEVLKLACAFGVEMSNILR